MVDAESAAEIDHEAEALAEDAAAEAMYVGWMETAATGLLRDMPGVLDYARRVILPDGEMAGMAYEPERHPGQMCTLQAIDAGASWVAIAKPVQDGGSLASFVPILRRVSQEAQTAIIAYPTKVKAEDAWRNKLWPILAAQGAQAPTSGSGSRGGAGSTTTLPSGGKIMLRASGGRHEAGQAADTADVLLCDELDDWEDIRRIKLIERRVSRSRSPLLIYVSTVKRDGTVEDGDEYSRILLMVVSGTDTRLHYPCHSCGVHQQYLWENVDVEVRCLRCIACKAPIDETQRLESLPLWRRVDKNRSDRFSILWTALDSPFALVIDGKRVPVMEGLCQEFEEASRYALRGDHAFLRQFTRDRLAKAYVEPAPAGEIDNRVLAALSERSTVDKRTVPAWATFLTMAQDVQGDRHYWLVLACGPGERWAVVDWGYELLVQRAKDDGRETERAPTPEDRRRVLGIIRDMASVGWQVEGGDVRMTPVQRGVDGGYLPDELANWIQGEPAWKFLRGVGKDDVKHASGGHEKRLPAEIRATKALQAVRPPGWRIYWYRIDGHHFRKAAHAALLRDPDQPASGLVPRGLKPNDALLLHLSGEVWDEGEEGKAGYWREVRKRHDWLDCLVYALALALLHRYAPDRRDEAASGEGTELPQAPRAAGGDWIAGAGAVESGDSWV